MADWQDDSRRAKRDAPGDPGQIAQQDEDVVDRPRVAHIDLVEDGDVARPDRRKAHNLGPADQIGLRAKVGNPGRAPRGHAARFAGR